MKMRRLFFSSFAAILLICSSCGITVPGKTFYIDAENGKDDNKGTNIQQPWKTLDKINSETFAAGDKVLLKRGQHYSGALHLKGSGKPGQPVKLSAYGSGRRPVIEAGDHETAIRLMDEQYWEISDIETSGGRHAGIFIGITRDHSDINHLRITNCYVHDVGTDSVYDWELNRLTGGIVVANGYINEGKPDFFSNSAINDVIVDGCTVRYIRQWTCISISSGWNGKKRGDSNFIRNCITEYSVADGIRMNGVSNSVIENSVMYKNGAWPHTPNHNWGGLGAWFFDADNCAIQYCEASFIDNWHNDGGAFDIDYYQTNSIIQDCYGHDCHGYGVSIFGADPSKPTVNSIVRNNVLRNNGRDSGYAYQGDFYVFTWNGGLLDGVQIYDNISIWNPVVNAHAVKLDADFTGTLPNNFRNNIIYSKNPWLVYAKNDVVKMDSNVYWYAGTGKPVWMADSINYYSLEEWQKKVRQDLNSHFRNPELTHSLDFSNEYDDSVTVSAGSSSPLSGMIPDSLKGKPLLLSFIDLHGSEDAPGAQATRAQLAFIKSMARQYGADGLKMILIDGSWMNERKLNDTSFNNFILDNELAGVSVIRDDQRNNFLQRFGVNKLPSTFLISPDGIIRKRWDGKVLPAALAFGIESLINKEQL